MQENIQKLLRDSKESIKKAIITYNNNTVGGEHFLKLIEEYTSLFVQNISSVYKPRVVLIGDYSIEWIAIYFSLINTGAIIIPIDENISSIDFNQKISFICPHIILSLSKRLSTIPETYSELDLNGINGYKYQAKNDLESSPENVMTMIFSSGTGGKEKLIMLSGYTVAAVVQIYMDEIKQYQCKNVLNILPLTAIYPLSIVLATIMTGGHIVLSNPQANFAALMNKNKIECLPAVPMLLEKLYESIFTSIKKQNAIKRLVFKGAYSINQLSVRWFNKNHGRKLFNAIHQKVNPDLKIILSGGAALDINKLIFLNAIGFNILEGYGLTEIGGIATVRKEKPAQFGSVGLRMNDVEIKISEANNEILIKSKRLFKGYYKDDSATKSAINDGWFHSGDVGYFDRSGCLHITGRLKDVIVRADETKQLPSLLENHYMNVVGMNDFAICGVPIPEHSGDKVVLFVANTNPTQQQELIDRIFRASKVSEAKYRLDQCLFVNELPRNKLGKICRQQLIKTHYSSVLKDSANE